MCLSVSLRIPLFRVYSGVRGFRARSCCGLLERHSRTAVQLLSLAAWKEHGYGQCLDIIKPIKPYKLP